MDTFKPYDYQEEAIAACLAAYEDGHMAHVLEIPTGGGKTLITGEVTRRFLSHRSMRGLITVPILDLVKQTRKKYEQYFFSPDEIGVVQGDTREYGRRVTIASIDTLAKPDCLAQILKAQGGQPFDVVFHDECHKSLAPKYQRTNAALVGPYTLLAGMSATPYRADNRSLLPVFPDGIAYSIDFLELIARGYLSDIWPKNIPTDLDLSQLDLEGLYDETETLPKSIVDRIKQSNVHARAYEAWMKFTGGTKHTIAFCEDIDDAYAWQRYVQAKGHECEVVTGKHSKNSRSNDEETGIYDRFQLGGSLRMLSNFNVLSTGIDFPHVECIIMMRAMNQGLWTQAVGRGLRLCDEIGKTGCHLLTMVDQHRTLMTMNKLIGTTEEKEISSVRGALTEKLEKEAKEELSTEVTHRISVAIQLDRVQARAYDMFAGDGWQKNPVTGSFSKDVDSFGTLCADRTFTGYQVYLRRKSGRRQCIAQTATDGKTACRMANLHLERMKIEQQKRKGDHPDLVEPITEAHWNYLKLRRVGCIGASWEDAINTEEHGDKIMRESHFYVCDNQLRAQKSAFGGSRVVHGPLPPLKKTATAKKKKNPS